MSKQEFLKQAKMFSHEAMASIFEIYMISDDHEYAAQSANEAFNLLDKIEQELSRYVENSDVSQINLLKSGEKILVGQDTLRCLLISHEIHKTTGGAFDITLDKDLCRESGRPRLSNSGMESIIIDPDNFTVGLDSDDVHIDLGGVGKGHALDRMAELLLEWDNHNFLVHGGYSSVIATTNIPDFEGWPVRVTNRSVDPPSLIGYFNLNNLALSCSGLQKEGHIISPFTNKSVKGNRCVWASHVSAAVSDALSTSFMIMSDKQIEEFCDKQQGVLGLVCDEELDFAMRFGDWSEVSFSEA